MPFHRRGTISHSRSPQWVRFASKARLRNRTPCTPPECDQCWGLVKRDRLLWVLITPAEDMHGSWIARVLDLGLTTQADSLEEAFEMVKDALRVAIISDVEKGLDPFDRKPSAREHWKVLDRLLSSPNRSRLDDLSPDQRNQVTVVAAQLAVSEIRQATVPMALEPWQFAQLEKLRESCLPS